MGLRYRKSVNIGPLRLNASKSGWGWSVGIPGVRYTKMANGRSRMTHSIPGTGISWVEESKKEPVEEEKFSWLDFLLGLGAFLAIIFVGIITVFGEAGSKR